jgi:hypothetical protein
VDQIIIIAIVLPLGLRSLGVPQHDAAKDRGEEYRGGQFGQSTPARTTKGRSHGLDYDRIAWMGGCFAGTRRHDFQVFRGEGRAGRGRETILAPYPSTLNPAFSLSNSYVCSQSSPDDGRTPPLIFSLLASSSVCVSSTAALALLAPAAQPASPPTPRLLLLLPPPRAPTPPIYPHQPHLNDK